MTCLLRLGNCIRSVATTNNVTRCQSHPLSIFIVNRLYLCSIQWRGEYEGVAISQEQKRTGQINNFEIIIKR
jgi:hypothetical protein